ncbi:MAG: polysaccharide biosynthesis/export family protein [Pseudohongiella sp.]|nr:polysaccharide biosynthesis/export family protein [Pseudohongiella sp.]
MSISSSLLKRFLILGILLLSAKAFTQETPFAEYIIGPADVLSVNVWQQEELSRTVTVRPDGFITYPLLGDLLVAGLTPLELRNQLAVSLGEYVNIMLSEVTVSVDEINSYTVSVMGEVNESLPV